MIAAAQNGAAYNKSSPRPLRSLSLPDLSDETLVKVAEINDRIDDNENEVRITKYTMRCYI